MGRQRDEFWDHAKNENGRFECNYCKQDFSGGASRIKAHLAGIPGHDIKACNAVPQDVQEKAQATQKKREAQVTQGTNKKLKSVSTSASKSKTKTIKIVTQGKEEYRAEIILNDVMDRLIANVSSLATKHINFELSFKVDLLETLFKIKFVLGDAQKRQLSDESMGIWLTELRNVAYDADNVVDKFSYESFWQKVRIQNQMMDQVCNFSLCNFGEVKAIKQSLDKIVNDVADFGLRMELVNSIPKISLDMNTDSLLDDLEVVGRKHDIKKIVNLLINSNNQQVISVLPIVGMAGLGKTTLAKLVYNHELIKKHFDVLVWVYVGKIFDVEEILRKILKSLSESLTYDFDKVTY
ncbi:putative disease resistance protein RGA3 [Quercus lobata]|uniref:putative disease resistance protein RGA3 n=1 Tax=Quercus lobata TaxID=97700 RepID=UPI00124412F1|nr:putative disease resistance protein RGA3 [Quercus lobata]